MINGLVQAHHEAATYYDQEWTEKGATLGDKAAMQKYGLNRAEIHAALRAGKLHFREQSMHGNPWFRLLRREVEALVAEKRGDESLRTQKLTAEIAEIDRQLRALKRQAAKLERRRADRCARWLPATIKGEMLDHESFDTRAEATAAIADYIDGFYNPHRLHSSIGYFSPIEFELRLSLMPRRDAA